MKINIEITEVIRMSRKTKKCLNVIINEQSVEVVELFKYFGSIIMDDVRSTTEIKTRIAMTKIAFSEKLLTECSLSKILLTNCVRIMALPYVE